MKRQQALNYYGAFCQACGSKKRITVHHKTYERFGNEKISDLMPLCWDCHNIVTAFHKRNRRNSLLSNTNIVVSQIRLRKRRRRT